VSHLETEIEKLSNYLDNCLLSEPTDQHA